MDVSAGPEAAKAASALETACAVVGFSLQWRVLRVRSMCEHGPMIRAVVCALPFMEGLGATVALPGGECGCCSARLGG